MAHSVNIGVLGLHILKCGKSHLQIKYDKTKKNQEGEKVNAKDIYDNPFDRLTSIYSALGFWFSIESASITQPE